MFRSNINRAVQPSDSPSVKVETGKDSLVTKWSKIFILLYKRLTVINTAVSIVEG